MRGPPTTKLAIAEVLVTGGSSAFFRSGRARAVAGGRYLAVARERSHARAQLLPGAPRHGSQAARYDKMHLFAFDNGREQYDEARVLEAGPEPVALRPSTSGRPERVL